MENIPAVANNVTYTNNAEFVKLTVYNDVSNSANVTVHTFSSSYKQETIDGQVYSPLGGLLAVGIQQRDIRATSADTSISLSGIDGNNMVIVLGTKIKGSKVDVSRGFYDANYNLSNTAHRFTGIITSYNINEDRHDLVDNFTITINASSFKSILENRVAGRKTNQLSWQSFNPTDSSVNNLYSISGQNFDFGMAPSSTPTNPSASTLDTTVSTQSITQK